MPLLSDQGGPDNSAIGVSKAREAPLAAAPVKMDELSGPTRFILPERRDGQQIADLRFTVGEEGQGSESFRVTSSRALNISSGLIGLVT